MSAAELEKQRLIINDELVESYMDKNVYSSDYGIEGIPVDLVKNIIQNSKTEPTPTVDNSKLPSWI